MRKITSRAMVIDNGKLLCVRQNSYEGSVVLETEYWCLPGGGLDDFEAVIPALKREIIEELGVGPVIGDLLYVQQFEHEGEEQLEFFFHVINSQDFMKIDLSKTSHGAKEIAEFGFIDVTKVNVQPRFLATEDLSSVKKSGNQTKIFSYLA